MVFVQRKSEVIAVDKSCISNAVIMEQLRPSNIGFFVVSMPTENKIMITNKKLTTESTIKIGGSYARY